MTAPAVAPTPSMSCPVSTHNNNAIAIPNNNKDMMVFAIPTRNLNAAAANNSTITINIKSISVIQLSKFLLYLTVSAVTFLNAILEIWQYETNARSCKK